MSKVDLVAEAISSIDCEKQYRGMVMDRVDGKWVINAEFSIVLAHAVLDALDALDIPSQITPHKAGS